MLAVDMAGLMILLTLAGPDIGDEVLSSLATSEQGNARTLTKIAACSIFGLEQIRCLRHFHLDMRPQQPP